MTGLSHPFCKISARVDCGDFPQATSIFSECMWLLISSVPGSKPRYLLQLARWTVEAMVHASSLTSKQSRRIPRALIEQVYTRFLNVLTSCIHAMASSRAESVACSSAARVKCHILSELLQLAAQSPDQPFTKEIQKSMASSLHTILLFGSANPGIWKSYHQILEKRVRTTLAERNHLSCFSSDLLVSLAYNLGWYCLTANT